MLGPLSIMRLRNTDFSRSERYGTARQGRKSMQSLKGRVKGHGIDVMTTSSVPTGREMFLTFGPDIEMPGYLQMSLKGQIKSGANLPVAA